MTQEKHFSLEALAGLTNCTLVGNPKHVISGVSDLETASDKDASFFSNPRYLQAMKNSKAGVIFVHSHTPLCEGKNYLVSEQPSRAFQQLIDTLHPPRKSSSGFNGIHSTAAIHETVQLGEHVTVGPHAVIDEGVCIGNGSFIGAGAYIGPGSVIGMDCFIHPRVVIREGCQIGSRVIIQPGAVIGSCGFGYTTDQQGRHIKLNQVGNVVIEDDVEIGANATIDRARFKETRIGHGTKIDNLVQIGHGVCLGPYNIIVGQAGIAGSTSTGHHVVIGGQVGIAGHLRLDDCVMVAAKSAVTKSLTAGNYGGNPAAPIHEHNRNQVFLRRIEKYVLKLESIAKQLKHINHSSEGDGS